MAHGASFDSTPPDGEGRVGYCLLLGREFATTPPLGEGLLDLVVVAHIQQRLLLGRGCLTSSLLSPTYHHHAYTIVIFTQTLRSVRRTLCPDVGSDFSFFGIGQAIAKQSPSNLGSNPAWTQGPANCRSISLSLSVGNLLRGAYFHGCALHT